MRPPLGATICGRGSRAVGVGEPRRGAPCPVRRGFYLFILVARFLRRPQKRHHGPGNAASGQAKPPLFPSMWCAQVIRHGLGHLSPAWMVCRANERGGVPLVFKRMAGQGSESRLVRPAARHGRGHGPGWRGAQPRPLTRQERPQPIGKGEEQGRSPLGLPPQPVGQVPTREALKPKRFQVKPEGREGGRRQTDEACSAHGRRPPAFSAKPCGGSAPMRLVLGLGG